jgi:hypothetical protein
MKEIIEVLLNLKDESYSEFVDFSKEVITFNYIEKDKVTKNIFIEKFYDYIETCYIKNNYDENDLAKVYVDYLSSAIALKVNKKSREEIYLNKLKDLAKYIKKEKEIDISSLEDFTRVFVALYCVQIKMDKELDFNLYKDRLDKTIKGLKESKTYKNLFLKNQDFTNMNVKYNKLVIINLLLELLYLDMLDKKPESDFGENYGK